MGEDTATVEFAIRDYRATHLEPVGALWDACRQIVPHNDTAKDIAICRFTAEAKLFVGIEGGRLVDKLMTGHDGHRGWFYCLAADPAHRHRGLERHMVNHTADWLKLREETKVKLMIREGTMAVVEFYGAGSYARESRDVMSRFLAGKAG